MFKPSKNAREVIEGCLELGVCFTCKSESDHLESRTLKLDGADTNVPLCDSCRKLVDEGDMSELQVVVKMNEDRPHFYKAKINDIMAG